MIGEIPYMIVWGFFSAMGWMSASYTDLDTDEFCLDRQLLQLLQHVPLTAAITLRDSVLARSVFRPGHS